MLSHRGVKCIALPAASLTCTELPWPQSRLPLPWTAKGTLAKAFCLLLPHKSSLPPCPLLLTLPLLFPKFYTADTVSVLVLADSFFQYTPEMEFLPSGPNSIMFCQNLVLKITAAENYQSAQSSRKTQFFSQERNLSFPFFSKFLKAFILSK